MPLQTSGPISLGNIQGEFTGLNPISLNEYYRGGAYVLNTTAAGTGSFQTVPMVPASPVQISTSGTIQMSQFYGTEHLSVGNTGIVTANTNNAATSDFDDITLPAGVDFIRFFLVGGGGGGGGKDNGSGGDGGAGSVISGTISTASIATTSVARTLRFMIGRGGQPGYSNVGGNSNSYPMPKGGHGYPLYGHTYGAWIWMNNYAVSFEMNAQSYQTSNVTSDRMVYFPLGATYTFQLAADNALRVYVDGVETANTFGMNDQVSTTFSSYSLSSPLTKSAALTAGWHKIRLEYTNTGGVGGYGVRIVDSGATEIWNTRRDYAMSYTWTYSPGGSGGYSGSSGNSGYGGAGGSATRLTLIVNGTEYLIAVAGGGGGGGGDGSANSANVRMAGNWATQGYSVSSYPVFAAGGEGEYVSWLNNASAYPPQVTSDGGGGGGGGGGIQNSRMYFMQADRQWYYSGFSGRTKRGNLLYANDADGDGGESGKSCVTASATRYADFVHIPSTGRNAIFPPSMPVNLSMYGVGGGGAFGTTASTAGVDGAGYVDWGITNASVPAPSIGRAALIASIVPYDNQLLNFQSGSYGTARIVLGLTGGYTSFTVDGFGGGGNPGSEYTYTWSNVVGNAGIATPNSYRTACNPTMTVGNAGTIRLTVSDGTSTATSDITWEVIDDSPVGG